MPLFSVIIPTYNRRELLLRALASVRAQTFTDYEVIVVDDGSTDGTWEELQALDSRVRALHQHNAGPGAARNLGAQHATGNYLAFLDSDDLWFPWTLASFAELILQNSSPAILSAKLIEFVDEVDLASVAEKPVKAEVFPDYYASCRRGYFVGAGMAVLRRAEFSKTGGFTTLRINAEDHDLILRMGNAPGFVQITEPVALGWRRHLGSVTMDVHRSFEGSGYLIEQELRGAFPGGASRAHERAHIITRRTRPVSLNCLRSGLRCEAWQLYRATFIWHLRFRRWKYLVGWPAKALHSCLSFSHSK